VEAKSFTVESREAGQRLDQFLASRMPEISRARVQELIEAGAVTVAGTREKASFRLRTGDLVVLTGESRRPPIKAEPEAIDIEVVYDDPEFAVVNKPAGMNVHAGAGDLSRSRGTLVNAMLHRFQTLSAVGDELRPGVVHRLDRDTSGLVIIAKTDFAHRKIAEQFQHRTVRKKYLTLVHGAMPTPSGTVNWAIDRDPERRTRMRALKSAGMGGRHATSHWRVVEQIQTIYGVFSLLEVQIETGRTHQIRVHLSALRHPVVGDALYGAPEEIRDTNHRTESLSLKRNFLHAAELEFLHPRTLARVSLHAPLPEELSAFLQRIRSSSP
jgi:23S rRNA pseudouridine1911/1915/1917 synthase